MKVKSNLDFESTAKATGLPAPTADTDAANKAYVDSSVEGLKWKQSCRVATTGALALSSTLEAGDTIDDITLAQGDRVLVKDQLNSENGIYIVPASGAPSRSDDCSTFDQLEGAVVSIEEGTENAGTSWRQVSVNGTIDSSNVLWGSFGTGSPTASETVSGISERATQTETDTGTDDARHVTPLKLKTSTNTIKRYEETIGDGASATLTVTHNLGSKDVSVEVYEAGGTENAVLVDWSQTSVNAIDVEFASAPASNSYRVVVKL